MTSDSALDLAAKRLERAVLMLEQRLSERLREAGAEAGGLFDQDRARLAAELDESRARERKQGTQEPSLSRNHGYDTNTHALRPRG